MQKDVPRIVLLVFILAAALLLTSCRGRVAAGDEPRDTAARLRLVQTGTQGVEIFLLNNFPPPYVYDQNELITLVEVRNRGNHDLQPQDCFVQITGFDPNIIGGGFEQPRSCAENSNVLEGKNVYNTEGGVNQLEFRSSSIVLPQNVYEYSPQLNFLSCYNYRTKANPAVCVDPLFFQVAAEQKTCLPKDVGMAGGQGAPVGVSHVGVEMVGRKAVFEITVRNFGTGRVLAPFSDIRSCGQSSLEYTDLDKVAYTVQMSGGNLIDCKPLDGLVRLNNNVGKVICQFDVPGATPFETPLQIELDYNYIQSFLRPVKIIKTPE